MTSAAGDSPRAADVTIRRAGPDDGPALGDVWLAAWRATFDFPPAHPDDDVRHWLATEMLPSRETWVATDGAGRVVALMALSETMVDHLYVAPEWIGRGVGSRLIELAKERRPDGLDLYCFQVNTRARRFYEGRGFISIATGDGSGNQEGQPDIRYAWRLDPVSPWAPSSVVESRDGTPIAVFSTGDGPPLILVHGATADHTTFRVVGPMLATAFSVHAIDRRGRGASGDTAPYAIAREFEDVAAVAEAIALESGVPVDVVGHSYGGRCALGAALRTEAIRRVVSYEGAPTPPGISYHPPGIEARLRERLDAGDNDGALAAFLAEVVGMPPADLEAYRADPVWPLRAAAAGTILRELEAEADPTASVEILGAVRQPVLQILGGASIDVFREATEALDERLADGRVVVIPGARHAAHHTHPTEFVEAVRAFLA